MKLLLVILLTLSFNVGASEWTKEDTRWQIADVVLKIVDAGTTADIKNHDDIEEGMPITRAIIGRNPSNVQVATYFTSMAVGSYLIARALPAPYRRLWQGSNIVVSAGCVTNNLSLGLRWGF